MFMVYWFALTSLQQWFIVRFVPQPVITVVKTCRDAVVGSAIGYYQYVVFHVKGYLIDNLL